MMSKLFGSQGRVGERCGDSTRMKLGICFNAREPSVVEERSDENTSMKYVDVVRGLHELEEALESGYKIVEVYHGVKYEYWTHNDANGEGGLFTSYINIFMKAKADSSGLPTHVKTEEEKAEFVKGYWEAEKIDLGDCKFERNVGRRAVTKLMLNSLVIL
uniref:Uncharacterized protein n=1 Tax=Caenorhabditis tropicalis TaxID=1561998 RepID=A0A1I7U2T1_9PELO